MKIAALILAAASVAFGQVTTVQNLGTTLATSAKVSMGTNTGDSQEEYIAAAALGIKVVRIGSCGWASVEHQSAPPSNTSTGLSLPTACTNDLTYAAQNGLTPELEALYGPPVHTILNLTVTSATSSGASTIPVTLTSGVGGDTFSTVAYPYDYIQWTGHNLGANYSYNGSLICSISILTSTTANITPCSVLNTNLTAGTVLVVNEQLYPSPVSGVYASEPSLQAYIAYARYLYTAGNAITTAINPAIHPKVGLWNEPPWPSEFWDNRTDGYDSNPGLTGNIGTNAANFGMVDGAQQSSSGDFIWDGPDKTGGASALGATMNAQTGHTLTQPTTVMNAESFHPYGNNPEDATYSYPCMVANPSSNSCNIISTSTSNAYLGVRNTIQAQNANGPTYGIQHVITETGASLAVNGNVITETQKARWDIRQYLGYSPALAGAPPNKYFIAFYRLYDYTTDGTTDSSAITLTTNGTPCNNSCSGANGYTVLPWGTAMAGFMADVNAIGNPTVEAVSVPTIGAWSGTYQLAQSSFAGARVGDIHNSYIVTVWQVSATTSTNCPSNPHTSACWNQLASPAPAPLTITVPAGYTLTTTNTTTRGTVTPSYSGSVATVMVADDAIELMLVPSLAGLFI